MQPERHKRLQERDREDNMKYIRRNAKTKHILASQQLPSKIQADSSRRGNQNKTVIRNGFSTIRRRRTQTAQHNTTEHFQENPWSENNIHRQRKQ